MNPAVVSEILAVGEMPRLDQIEILAMAGFQSIITMQPDGEVERFAASAAIGIEAVRHGLAHAYAPITSRTPSPEELAVFERALAELPPPIFACCYSGARSAAAAAHVLTANKEVDVIIREFAGAGFDIASLRSWLEDERRRRAPQSAEAATIGMAGATLPATSAAPSPVTVSAGEMATAREPAAVHVGPEAAPPPIAAAKAAVQGIVVHARLRSASGFAY